MEIKYRTQLGDLLKHFNLVGEAAEIGVAEGRNAQVLAKSENITKLYLIDSWTQLAQKGDGGSKQEWHENNFKEAQERLKESGKGVFLRGLSVDMIATLKDESLVLGYVDADHEYLGALNDLKAIWPKIKSGGILSGHDYLNPAYGVREAVNTFVSQIQQQYGETLLVNVIEEDHFSMAGFYLLKK